MVKILTRVGSTFLLDIKPYINYEKLFSYYCIHYCGHNVDAGFNMIMLYTILIFKIAKKATLTRQIQSIGVGSNNYFAIKRLSRQLSRVPSSGELKSATFQQLRYPAVTGSNR